VSAPPTSPEAVTATLRAGILDGTYPGGTPLRQESIAAALGVSRMPVREAFRHLAAEGLIILHPHRGAVVATLSAHELQEIYEMRAALEPLALRLALPRLTKGDLGKAEEALDAARDETNPERLAALNWDFHHSLYQPADRPRLLATISNLHLNVDRYMRVVLTVMQHHSASHAEHEAILEACRARDEAAATRRLEAHITHAGRQLVEFLGRT